MPFSFLRVDRVLRPLPDRGGNRVGPRSDTLGVPLARRASTLIFIPILALFLPQVSVSVSQDRKADAAIRSCGHLDEENTATTLPKRKKHHAAPVPTTYIPSCLEVPALPLDVQERLQQFVRQQNWAVFDEEINETLWSFSLPLTKQELFTYANPPPGTDRVSWDRGKTVVLVRTVSLSNGYSRTTIAAQFRGFGESDDTFATQRSFWEWSSSGKLEARLTAELRTRFAASH